MDVDIAALVGKFHDHVSKMNHYAILVAQIVADSDSQSV